MKLIFFGGIKGVGKTTLLTWLENEFAGEIKLLDPGELFRYYCYNQMIKTPEEVEELIAEKILEMPHDSVVVLHWHYAVLQPSGYIPQISFSRLKRIAKSGKVEQIILLQLEAPIDAVRERRLKDSRTKKRDVSLWTINEEVGAEKEFLARHQDLFSRILGRRKVTVFHLIHSDLETTKPVLYQFFKEILNRGHQN